jgi:hypothetical protein
MGRLERWLFAPGSAERLAAVRIGLCSVLAARLAFGPYTDLAGQPAALFRPRSFMHVLPSMPSRGLTLALQAVGVSAAVLAATGFRTRLTMPAAWAVGAFLAAMPNSMGKVVHNDVLLLLCLVPLIAAPIGDAWAVGGRRPAAFPSIRYGWPVRTAMVVIAGSYLFVGLGKVLHAGPAWVTSDNLRWVMLASSDAHADPNHLALFVGEHPLLARGLAGATLLFELTFPLALIRSRLLPLYVVGAVALHLGIYLTMGLDYSVHAATVVIVLVDWPALADRVLARRGVRAVPVRAPDRVVRW